MKKVNKDGKFGGVRVVVEYGHEDTSRDCRSEGDNNIFRANTSVRIIKRWDFCNGYISFNIPIFMYSEEGTKIMGYLTIA